MSRWFSTVFGISDLCEGAALQFARGNHTGKGGKAPRNEKGYREWSGQRVEDKRRRVPPSLARPQKAGRPSIAMVGFHSPSHSPLSSKREASSARPRTLAFW